MTLPHSRLHRLLALVAVTTGLLLTGAPARASHLVKIGLPNEPKNFNVLRATDRWSNRILSLLYQPLLIRDPETLELVPWLAAAPPTWNADDLTYTVRLRDGLQWSDGSPLTSEDVAFTCRIVQELKIPKYYSKWKFVSKVETPDDLTVRYTLTEPKAVFLTRSLMTPVVPKKEWAGVLEKAKGKEKPLSVVLNHRVKKPMSSGPFVLERWKRGGFLYLTANKHFFGTGMTIAGHTLGPHVDGLLFKFFGTSDAAILALKKGDLDMFWWGIQPGYLEDLENNPEIELYRSERSALYYMGFNLRKAPFDDPALRRAMATLVDKDFIITRILHGRGVPMDAIVPPGNRVWCCPNPMAPGKGLSRDERVRQAYELLKQAGYSWETPPVSADGKIRKGKGIRLPDGTPMTPWTILTPPTDYDPLRAVSGTIIQGWLRDVGIPATARPMALGALLETVKTKHEFDAFILAYGSLSLDPDYLRSFFHSANDKPRGWNMSGYQNDDVDRLAEASAGAVDRPKRQELIYEIQRIVSQDVPYLPLYNPDLIEATRREHITGWVSTLGGIGNIWSFCEVRPK